MSPKKIDSKNDDDQPRIKIADPIDELKALFTERTEALDNSLKTSIKNQNQITLYVIIVMGIGFVLLLFALASVLVVSYQSNQTVHDAVQLQINSTKTR